MCSQESGSRTINAGEFYFKLFFFQPFPSQFRESFMSLKSGNPDLMQTINYLADDLPIREFKPLARHLGLKELDFEQLEARYSKNRNITRHCCGRFEQAVSQKNYLMLIFMANYCHLYYMSW